MKLNFSDRIPPWLLSVLMGLVSVAVSVGYGIFVEKTFRVRFVIVPGILAPVLTFVTYRSVWKYKNLLRAEQEKSEQLLQNILPLPIIEQLKSSPQEIAQSFDETTILFTDIVGFTPLAATLPPAELVRLLNQIFSLFDELAERYQVEKIKTIGDAYMVVAGAPVPRQDHAEVIAEMALAMHAAVHAMRLPTEQSLQLRSGMHTGSVVAGIIGKKKFTYDIWGDTVNLASRMESQGLPGEIQVSPAVYERLQDRYAFRERGKIEVKGRGEMTTYFLVGPTS